MTEMTDPARELADVCERLVAPQSSQHGAAFLAEKFGVEQWSTEFYQMIFHIRARIDHLVETVAALDIDAELREQAIAHAKQVQKAFSPDGLNNQWSHASAHLISPEHVRPLKFLSPEVRRSITYPKLSEDERNEISGMVGELLLWLGEHQIKEHDFIRQALIEGLLQFQFRFDRFQWLGWGYALQSLRDVIGAYMALERAVPDLKASPDADAILRKTGAVMAQVYGALKKTKEAVDIGKLILALYGAAALLSHGPSNVARLLASGTKLLPGP